MLKHSALIFLHLQIFKYNQAMIQKKLHPQIFVILNLVIIQFFGVMNIKWLTFKFSGILINDVQLKAFLINYLKLWIIRKSNFFNTLIIIEWIWSNYLNKSWNYVFFNFTICTIKNIKNITFYTFVKFVDSLHRESINSIVLSGDETISIVSEARLNDLIFEFLTNLMKIKE